MSAPTSKPHPGRGLSPLRAHQVVKALLDWYATHARDLPWRHTSDPYAIWVSEVMLQQTQVNSVIPYWNRWMAAFPTIDALANARQSKVLRLWAGLGYYSRARNLQKAAQTLQRSHQSQFPREYDEILSLPGIGAYTAGAVASIAFELPSPVLDGNATRVLARLLAIPGAPRQGAVRKRLESIARCLAEAAARTKGQKGRAVSRFNQSLMELGALVCLPRAPRCSLCPLRRSCRAYSQQAVERFPQKPLHTPAVPRHFFAFVLQRHGHFLFRRRPSTGINANFWEFPNVESRPASAPDAAWSTLFGSTPGHLAHLTEIRHSITHYRITIDFFLADAEKLAAPLPARARWWPRSRLASLPLATAHRKALDLLPFLTTPPPLRRLRH